LHNRRTGNLPEVLSTDNKVPLDLKDRLEQPEEQQHQKGTRERYLPPKGTRERAPAPYTVLPKPGKKAKYYVFTYYIYKNICVIIGKRQKLGSKNGRGYFKIYTIKRVTNVLTIHIHITSFKI